MSSREASLLLLLVQKAWLGKLCRCTSHRDSKRSRNVPGRGQKRRGRDKTPRELNGSMAEGCEDKKDDIRAEQGQASNDKLFSR